MKVLGIAGWSGSGKTTLLCRLLPELISCGLEVATLKHTHHASMKFRDEMLDAVSEAGFCEIMVASSSRFSLFHTTEDDFQLETLTSSIKDVDLLLVEGFKSASHPKLEVWDRTLDKPRLDVGRSNVIALVGEGIEDDSLPCFHRDDIHGITLFIVRAFLGLRGIAGERRVKGHGPLTRFAGTCITTRSPNSQGMGMP